MIWIRLRPSPGLSFKIIQNQTISFTEQTYVVDCLLIVIFNQAPCLPKPHRSIDRRRPLVDSNYTPKAHGRNPSMSIETSTKVESRNGLQIHRQAKIHTGDCLFLGFAGRKQEFGREWEHRNDSKFASPVIQIRSVEDNPSIQPPCDQSQDR